MEDTGESYHNLYTEGILAWGPIEPLTPHSSERASPGQQRQTAERRAYAAAVLSVVCVASAPSASCSGGFAPSRAHGSSNSTRHLPSSPCSSASFARNERPERPRNPVTALAVLPVEISSRTTATGSCLPALLFQITNPQPGSSRDQHE